ncbi:MAG TPA: DegQ family serine endoprotease [Stellaceae bacterium]|nr:DegQ family serine endoprotease [Stellaceae bacterium]
MNDPVAGRTRIVWLTRGRAAALGLGLGATLALSPFVWAESSASSTLPAAAAANRPAASPVALIQQESFAPLVKQVLPAVVNISVTQKTGSQEMSGEENIVPFPDFPNSPFNQFLHRFFNQQGQGGERHFFQYPGGQVKRIALGSGFIVDPKGYVVTNNHVVGDAASVQVILQDGHKYRAKIIGRDPKTDLAVLKIAAEKPLPHVEFGDSSAAQIGDWVMAVGNPFGLGGTVTTGIISARGRNIDAGPFDDFLQIDAPINRGNSGGPTFNLQGQVIGINTAIYSPNGGSVGIGFAIPSNEAKTIVAQLIEHGTIKRGWLGVQIQKVTPAIAASLGLARDHGALIAVVKPGSPGAKAGLKQGDVILTFNGHDIARLRDLPRYVAATPPHSAAAMTVWRDGKKLDMQATVGNLANNEQVASARRGEEEQAPTAASALGMHFAALTDRVRRELRVGKDVRGVVITGVDTGSLADNVGLSRGDIVVAINQMPVRTPEEAAQQLRKIAKSSNKSALLLLNRHGVTEYVGVTVGKKEG